jgi:hypothetical protein
MLFGFLASDLGEKIGFKEKSVNSTNFANFLEKKTAKFNISKLKNKKNQTVEFGTSFCLIFLHQR